MQDCGQIITTYGSLDFNLWHTITHAHKQQTAIHMIPATTDTQIISTVRASMCGVGIDSLSAGCTKDDSYYYAVLWLLIYTILLLESTALHTIS